MSFRSALTSSKEMTGPKLATENDEAKFENISSPSTCTKAFLQPSSQESRVVELNVKSDGAEFCNYWQWVDTETPGEVSEFVIPKRSPSDKISTFRRKTPVHGGLAEKELRANGWHFPEPSPDWYQRQKECYREPDDIGEHWMWKAGGDCPA
jgi:hypothetical protein